GVNRQLNGIPKHFTTALFSTYDIEACYRNANVFSDQPLEYLFCIFPTLIDPTLAPENKHVVRTFLPMSIKATEHWKKDKEIIYRKVIRKLSTIIPGVENDIEVREIGTPETFQKITSNRDGAILGWSSTPAQSGAYAFPNRASVENLFLTGHWTTNGIGQSGISVVALSGKDVAGRILKNWETLS
ncbi:MAG: FAD-dependent oxidoreductase, partial [Candidatus Omnitrophica bacterium]|nr:FAD-dependent oxidoreductase [Candidatus Omnitrophota bacterium]